MGEFMSQDSAGAAEPQENVLNNILLFFASPFVALAYLVALPFVMSWMLLPVVLDWVRKYNAMRKAEKLEA
jgi:hypothetical protein